MSSRLYEGMSLREISDYLFVADEPQPADLILALGASRPERAGKVVDLYRSGFAPRILITGGDKQGTGVAEADQVRGACLEQGVPDAVIALENRSLGTLENVVAAVALIDQLYGWSTVRTILLVTAPLHMCRARHVLARHVPDGVTIICCPDHRTDVSRDNWWQTETGRTLVFRELEKVRTYAIRGEF